MKEKKEQVLEKARNRFNNKEEEVIFRHFIKNRLGYMVNLFFGKNFWLYLLAVAFCVGMYLFANYKEPDDIWSISPLALGGLFILCYLIEITIGLWFWKYSKHVVVTNQGIWIMCFSTFWWSKAYNDKKYLCSPHWSFYEWRELKSVKEFETRTSKLLKLKNFSMERWDGVEKVCLLNARDVDAIITYSKEMFKEKRRKKKNA